MPVRVGRSRWAPATSGVAPGNIMFSTQEITNAPSSGTAFNGMQTNAGATIGTVDLNNQDATNGPIAYAAALMYIKTGTTSYRTKVETAVAQLPTAPTPPRTTEAGGVLSLGRQLAGWIIAADIVGYRDSALLTFADDIRTRFIGGHGLWDVITTTSQITANNWGCHALAGRTACSAYLGDTDDLDEIANIFRRFTGQDRSTWTGWNDTDDHDPTWVDSTPDAGINGPGADPTIAGAVVEDICRSTGSAPTVDLVGLSYSWEALAGSMVTAKLLYRTGRYGDTFAWGSNALLRAATFINSKTPLFAAPPYAAYPPRYDESQWVPNAINGRYGATLGPLGDPTQRGWCITSSDWIF